MEFFKEKENNLGHKLAFKLKRKDVRKGIS
jgi:hypothetical protein